MPTSHTPLQTLELHPAHPAVASIVVLHGLGADGTDFLSFADELDLSAVGPVRWVFPRAPVRPVTLNNGMPMRAWYDIPSLNLQRGEDEAGLRDSFAGVHALLERERERGVPAERIILAGFSQGCAVTLGAGLRYPQRLAGLVGMSGYLPLATHTADERHSANQGTPILLAHGSRDAVVAPARGEAARDSLGALGYGVQWNSYPMEHSVCIEEVRAIEAFARQVLTTKA